MQGAGSAVYAPPQSSGEMRNHQKYVSKCISYFPDPTNEPEITFFFFAVGKACFLQIKLEELYLLIEMLTIFKYEHRQGQE